MYVMQEHLDPPALNVSNIQKLLQRGRAVVYGQYCGIYPVCLSGCEAACKELLLTVAHNACARC